MQTANQRGRIGIERYTQEFLTKLLSVREMKKVRLRNIDIEEKRQVKRHVNRNREEKHDQERRENSETASGNKHAEKHEDDNEHSKQK